MLAAALALAASLAIDVPYLAQTEALCGVARASRRAGGDESPAHLDVGAGFRLGIRGAAGVLRVDVAHGVRDGANALTFGWQF